MSSAASSSRYDGRAPAELRPLSFEFGQLDRADGSGRFGFGSSAALASITGPIEVRLREELPDKATFEVVHRPLEGVSATPSRAMINTLQAVFPPLLNLGQHPRSLVQLIVQSLSAAPSTDLSQSSLHAGTSAIKSWPSAPTPTEEDGFISLSSASTSSRGAPMSGSFFSSRAAIINASTLAILDGGAISMRALPIAVSLAYIRETLLVLDPTSKEEIEASSRHALAYAFGLGISSEGKEGGDMEIEGEEGESELVYLESEGEFSRQQLEDVLAQGKIAARRILEHIREQLADHLQKRIQR